MRNSLLIAAGVFAATLIVTPIMIVGDGLKLNFSFGIMVGTMLLGLGLVAAIQIMNRVASKRAEAAYADLSALTASSMNFQQILSAQMATLVSYKGQASVALISPDLARSKGLHVREFAIADADTDFEAIWNEAAETGVIVEGGAVEADNLPVGAMMVRAHGNPFMSEDDVKKEYLFDTEYNATLFKLGHRECAE